MLHLYGIQIWTTRPFKRAAAPSRNRNPAHGRTTIGLDIAKSVFQVHGVDAAGQVVIRRALTRCACLAHRRPKRSWQWPGLFFTTRSLTGLSAPRR